VPFSDALLNAPLGGGVGLDVPLPPPQPANITRAENAMGTTKRVANAMTSPEEQSVEQGFV
jgi:hypothetical protein